jgi:secondary thiamine-phosphate synthase enzyme
MEYPVKTTKAQEFVNITSLVNKAVSESGVKDGVAIVFVPHTTAGVTINENADPDVVKDILSGLNKAFPEKDNYLHIEGNSHAHIKASLMGSSCSIIIENGKLKLGTWQGVYFCEFDGSRNRKVYIKII